MPIFIKTVLRCSICHFTSGFRLPSVLFLWDRIRSETAESRECTASATEEIHSASSSQRRKERSGNSTSRTQVIQTGRFLTLYAELKPKKNFQTKNAAQKEIPVPPSFQTAGVRQKLFYRRSRFAQNPAFRFLIHPHTEKYRSGKPVLFGIENYEKRRKEIRSPELYSASLTRGFL